MKTIFTLRKALFMMTALAMISSLFAQRFEWVNFTPILSGYPNGGSGGQAMTRDNSGYLYSLATLSEPVIAGNDTIYPLYPGSTDIYLTKWSPAGDVVWAKPFGGNWYDDGFDINYDSVNNVVYATCHIQGTETVMNDTTYNNSGQYQMICFDPSGNFIKTAFIGWSNNQMAIMDTLFYYTDNWNTIKRMRLDGTVLWSLSPSSVGGYFFINNVAVTPQGDMLAAGIFGNSFIIGEDTVYAASATAGEASFLIKADTSGQVIFAKYIGSLNLTYYYPIPIAGDDEGNTYIAERYSQPGLIYGNDTLPVISSGSGAFVAKFDTAGNAIWGRHFYGTNDTWVYDIVLNDEDIFVCGSFTGPMHFGTIILPYTNGYVAKLDEYGDYLMAKEVGTYNGSSWCSGIEKGGTDHYYLNGTTYGGGSNSVFGCYTQAYSNQYVTAFKDTVAVIPEITISQYSDLLIADYNCSCSIQWYLNGGVVPEAKADTFQIVENGDYYAMIYDNYNCSSQSNTITITNAGIKELNTDRIKIVPNPFTSTVTVKLLSDNGNSISVSVKDITGKSCFTSEVKINTGENMAVLDLSALEKGIYLLEIKTGSESIIKKIIRQ